MHKKSVISGVCILLLYCSIVTGCTGFINGDSAEKNGSAEQAVSFTKLRDAWRSRIIDTRTDGGSGDAARLTASLSGVAEKHFAAAVDSDDGCPWIDEDVSRWQSDPAHLRRIVMRLEWIAKAWATPLCSRYHDAAYEAFLKRALRWVADTGYPRLSAYYGNWWYWELAIPEHIGSVCILLYDVLDSELIRCLTGTVLFYQSDPYYNRNSPAAWNGIASTVQPVESRGANRIDSARVALLMAILSENGEQLRKAFSAASDAIQYEIRNSDGSFSDGFYEDGTFRQHIHVPYTGTYGSEFLLGACTLFSVFASASMSLPEAQIRLLYEFAQKSFIPCVYKGIALDMLRGRAVSRYNESDHVTGHNVIGGFLVLANLLPAGSAEKKEIQGHAKSWILEDSYREFLKQTSDPYLLMLAEKTLADNSVTPAVSADSHILFPYADRVIHRRKNFVFSVSMFSKRVCNFESINGENKHGWHSSDGMTYLYDSDASHYSDGFWAAVNPYRLAGTTVDPVPLIPGKGSKLFSRETWVGGVSLDKYGSAGMQLSGNLIEENGLPIPDTAVRAYPSLRAKKSWFMFDNEIVCLGADISSQDAADDTRHIETILENRRITDVPPDRCVFSGAAGSVRYFHVRSVANSRFGIGYILLQPQSDIRYHIISRTGSWSAIGLKGALYDTVVKNFFELWIDHGKNPQRAAYAYIILPAVTSAELVRYAAAPEITVISNTERVQAVCNLQTGNGKTPIWGIHVWTDDPVVIQPAENSVVFFPDVSVDGAGAFLLRYDTERQLLELAVSDPTMEKRQIRIGVSYEGAPNRQKKIRKIITADAFITARISDDEKRADIMMNCIGAEGKSSRILFGISE